MRTDGLSVIVRFFTKNCKSTKGIYSRYSNNVARLVVCMLYVYTERFPLSSFILYGIQLFFFIGHTLNDFILENKYSFHAISRIIDSVGRKILQFRKKILVYYELTFLANDLCLLWSSFIRKIGIFFKGAGMYVIGLKDWQPFSKSHS